MLNQSPFKKTMVIKKYMEVPITILSHVKNGGRKWQAIVWMQGFMCRHAHWKLNYATDHVDIKFQ